MTGKPAVICTDLITSTQPAIMLCSSFDRGSYWAARWPQLSGTMTWWRWSLVRVRCEPPARQCGKSALAPSKPMFGDADQLMNWCGFRHFGLREARQPDPRVPAPGTRLVRFGYVYNKTGQTTERRRTPCIRSGIVVTHAHDTREASSVRANEALKSRLFAPQHARGRSTTPTEPIRVRHAHARPPGRSPGCLPGAHRLLSAAARAAGATRAAAHGRPLRPASAACCAGAARGVHRPSSKAPVCVRE